MNDRMEFFSRIARNLSRAPSGSVQPVDEGHIIDILPHHWREEGCHTIEEWFIRYCRGLGLHATYDPFARRYNVRITKDIADEATITWPGKPAPC